MDEPTLSEADGIRYLHFGTEWVQGAMSLRQPSRLVLEYTRQMMAFLLFQHYDTGAPPTVALLGLGAGSLHRFLLKHTPFLIETVEWNPQLMAVCQAYFRLKPVPRLKFVVADARPWIAEQAQHQRFATVLVDLYDGKAQGPVGNSPAFYEACQASLTPQGIALFNLFGNHQSYLPNLERIQAAFQHRVLLLPQTRDGNRIVLAYQPLSLSLTAEQVIKRAEELERLYQFPALKWARTLIAQLPVA